MRTLRPIACIALALMLCASCRTTRPEAGLPPSVFQGLFPRVVSNDRGFWFLVTDGKSALQPFVVLGTGTERELFYAVPMGRRTARLLPLTPFAYPLLDSVRQKQRVDANWLMVPSAAGDDLPDSVGWMDGAQSAPAWAGPIPADGTPVVLVAGALTGVPEIGEWLVGTAVVRDGKLSAVQFDGTPNGPIAVIPDGTVPERPIRAGLAGLSAQPVPGVEFSSIDIRVPEGPASTFTTRPAALRAGVDALVSARTTETADITLTRPIIRRGLPLSVTDEPLTVSRENVSAGLLALRDVAAGRDMSAAKRLLELASALKPPGSSRMRALELVAGAGFVDWTRQALMADARGLGADDAVYLSRSHFVAGDFARAADFASRAQDRFVGWPGAAGGQGMAQAKLLSARLAAQAGDWDSAFALAIESAKQFEAATDSMRAADAELLAASYAVNAQDFSRAVKAAALARSRFFHGKSSYHAAFAELALADIYARAGEHAEAMKLTDYALKRFEQLEDNVGRNRARIAEGRVAGSQSRAQGVRNLEIGLEKAQTTGDFVGVVDAAASLVVLGGAPKDATASYGLVIAAGMARTVDPYVRERAAQALTLLCGRGMADSVDRVQGASARDIAIAKSACAAPANVEQPAASMITALVAQGWAAWRLGDAEEASSVAQKLETAVDDEVRQTVPRSAAEALFLGAVVIREIELTRSEELAAEGVRVLAEHIDPVELARTLNELATQYVARGQIWLGAALLKAAMTAAGDQSQTELRRILAMRRVDVLHSAGDYDAALAAARDAEGIVAGAGPASAALLSRLMMIEADALKRLGNGPDSAVMQAKATASLSDVDPVTQVRLTLLSGQLATQRGDGAAATADLVRAARLESALAVDLSDGEDRKLLRARIKLAQADVARDELQSGAASNGYTAALDDVADLADSEPVLALRIDARRGLGMTTTSDDRVDESIRALEQLRGTTIAKFPRIAPSATAALAALQISAGRPSRALEVLAATGLDGVAAAENPTEALCTEARAAGLSGRAGAARMLDRCAAASRGGERADAALLSVLIDSTKDRAEKNRIARELAAADSTLGARQRERLAFVSELAAGVARRDDNKEARLTTALQRALDAVKPRAVVSAIDALVDYYASTGEPSRSQSIVDQNSASFYDLGPNGPGVLARLRAELGVGLLNPVAGFAFASRAVAETPDLEADDEAGLLFASAQNAVILGMWQGARSDLTKARAAAARNASLRRRIEQFGRRFSLL